MNTTCRKSIIYLHVNPITLLYITLLSEERCRNRMRVYADLLAPLFARQKRPLNYANPPNICISYTVYSDDTTLNPFNNRGYTRRTLFYVFTGRKKL